MSRGPSSPLWVQKLLKIHALPHGTAKGSSSDRDVGVMNVMWSWGIEAPLSPLSPENLTEWLGYAAPLTKINYICWKIFQHFFSLPYPLDSSPIFIYFSVKISSLFGPHPPVCHGSLCCEARRTHWATVLYREMHSPSPVFKHGKRRSRW